MVSTFVLRYRLGDAEWQEFQLSKDEILIGRGVDCDLSLDHEEISRVHARLSRVGEAFMLTDLGSSNGTYVMGQPLPPNTPVSLEIGTLVEIGGFTLSLHAPGFEATSLAKDRHPLGREVFHLRYRYADGEWQTYVLPDGDTTFGRGEESDMALDDDEISRRHAVLTFAVNKLTLTDVGSTNGTFIDGVQLEPHQKYPLKIGQFIAMGHHTLYVEAPEIVGVMHSASGTMVMPGEAISLQQVGPGAMVGEPKTMLDAEVPVAPSSVRTMNLTGHDKVSIGRAADNQVVLNHPMVSRYHAVLERMGKRFVIKDLRSSNGIYVNEQRIEREAYLKDWDQIRIGVYVFVISGQQLQGQIEQGIRIEAANINQVVSSGLNLLKDISLTMEPNEFVALVGMSGAGKSTFMNAISGYWPASHGYVLVNGINLYDHYDMFRDDIGYVPQKDIVHAELTPESALDYVAQLRMPPDTTSQERQAVVSEVLRELDLTERKDIPISSLSGGQLKRVSIGVELLTKPRLFFLDEPTSGLDPGTEYDMMNLMRRLADQGRTIILITHATKNVMMCDKVIFLARGGNMAFYGAPEDALEYFDHYRTERERREKDMEFDDIYRILNDDSRGSPEVWRERYLQSPVYRNLIEKKVSTDTMVADRGMTPAGKVQGSKKRISSLRQFKVLSARNLKILVADKISLGLMVALAPVLGLMDFIWGNDLYDPIVGDASKIVTLWFMMALITVLVGAMSSVREIVKEDDIYKRERAVNLKILPYVMSKIWVGVVLAVYQAGVLLLFRILFVQPSVPSNAAYFSLYITLFLGTLCGYLIGLTISAIAPNQNSAMMLIIVVLVPQFLFAGALLPLDLIPGGEQISFLMPTRWSFESFIRITGVGEQLNQDPCWTSFPKADRLKLPDELKGECACMGASIFSDCADFPGILSDDFYDEKAQAAIVNPEPIEPAQPTPYLYPTAYPSPTALPTPTLLPSLTPYPTPSNPQDMGSYMDQRQEQGNEYQDSILGQFDGYREDSKAQGAAYSEVRTAQGDEYAELREAQGDEYAADMTAYGDERAEWQESREKAINSAEAVLGSIYDNFQQAFRGTVIGRWMIMGVIMAALVVAVLVFQKRKDVV